MIADHARRATASAKAWISTSSATTAKRRRSRSSSPASRTRAAPTWRSSGCGTRRPARRSSSPVCATTRTRRRPSSRSSRSCRRRPASRRRSRCTSRSGSACSAPTAMTSVSKLDSGEAPADGVVSLTKRKQTLPLRRCALAAGAVAAARLLRAGQRHARPARRRRRVADGERQRSVQPLAGRQHLRRAHAGRGGRRACVGQEVEPRPALCAGARRGAAGRRPRAGLSRRVAEAADAGRRRPRSSARNVDPALVHPCPPRADEAHRHDARRPSSKTSTRRWARPGPSRPTRRAPAAARCATPR